MKSIYISLLLVFSITAFAQTPAKAPAAKAPAPLGANLDKIKSFNGILEQIGVFKDDQVFVGEIWYEAPDKYFFRATAPMQAAGSLIMIEGSVAKIYYPSLKFAITYRGLPSTGAMLKTAHAPNPANYKVEAGKVDSVAALPTREFRITPLKPSVTKNAIWRVHEPFDFPLEKTTVFNNGKFLTETFKSITFNTPPKNRKPAFVVPLDALLVEWNLGGQEFTERQIRLENPKMQFSIPQATQGLRLNRIVRQKGEFPVYAAFYSNAGRAMIVTFHVERKGEVSTIEGMGVPLPSTRFKDGLMIPFVFNSYTFKSNDVRYFMSGNLQIDEMVAAADEFDKPVAPAKPNAPKAKPVLKNQ